MLILWTYEQDSAGKTAGSDLLSIGELISKSKGIEQEGGKYTRYLIQTSSCPILKLLLFSKAYSGFRV